MASLSYLSFEGATKRNRPDVKVICIGFIMKVQTLVKAKKIRTHFLFLYGSFLRFCLTKLHSLSVVEHVTAWHLGN